MRDFKFFRGSDLKVSHQTINDAIRYDDHMVNRNLSESIVDNAQMARDIRELSRLRMEFDRSLQRSNEFLHRGRRPRN
jgi:hypothetical protein